MAIDFARLNSITNPTELRLRCQDAFREAGDFPLSDVLMQRTTAATHILLLLADEAQYGGFDKDTNRRNTSIRRKYRIKVLRDMWGAPVAPGTVIEWKADYRRKSPTGVRFTTRDMMELRRQNREDEFLEYHAARVDADGCITVEFDDAGKLLINNGVYYATGGPICSAREVSSKPRKAPDGSLKHRHNWLYMEIPPGFDMSTIGRPKRRVSLVSDGGATNTPPAPTAPVEVPKAKRGRKPKGATSPVESAEPPAAE
jgi:hypothetical protein